MAIIHKRRLEHIGLFSDSRQTDVFPLSQEGEKESSGLIRGRSIGSLTFSAINSTDGEVSCTASLSVGALGVSSPWSGERRMEDFWAEVAVLDWVLVFYLLAADWSKLSEALPFTNFFLTATNNGLGLISFSRPSCSSSKNNRLKIEGWLSFRTSDFNMLEDECEPSHSYSKSVGSSASSNWYFTDILLGRRKVCLVSFLRLGFLRLSRGTSLDKAWFKLK